MGMENPISAERDNRRFLEQRGNVM